MRKLILIILLALGYSQSTEPCSGCDLPENTIYLTNDGEVFYNSTDNIGGFHLQVEGASVVSASGGDVAEAGGYNIQTFLSTVVGALWSGSGIPPGCGTLTVLELSNFSGSPIFFSLINVDDGDGNAVYLNYYEDGIGALCECGGYPFNPNHCDCDGNVFDGCGVCGGLGFDCNGECNGAVEDCAGVCGGNSVVDECGECAGEGIDEGTCDCDGNVVDECGVCDGPGAIYECGCDDEQLHCRDLDGDGFGTSEFTLTTCDVEGDIWVLNCEDLDDTIYCESNEADCAGILCGDTIYDCAGTCGGSAELDNCDTCDNDASNDCVQDCAGVWGGTAMIDCFDVCNGGAVIDECDVCGGPGAIYECGCADLPAGDCDCEGNVIQDFYADWDGDGYGDCDSAYSYCPSDAEDWMSSECGDCDNSNADAIVVDCAGECGGSAVVDECGECGGDNECYVVIDTIANQTMDEDNSLQIGFNVISPGSIIIFNSLITSVTNGSTEDISTMLTGSSDDGFLLTVTPVEDWNGVFDVWLEVVNEYSISDTESFSVTVNAVNDAPYLLDIPDADVESSSVFTYELQAVDVDGDDLIYTVTTNVAEVPNIEQLTASVSGNILIVTPQYAQNEIVLVTITVADGLATDIENFNLTVFTSGCTEPDCCNYTPGANVDDGSCVCIDFSEGYCDCDGTIEDCFGVCGGSAELDCEGVCGGDAIDADEDGICDNIDDCVGEYDICGICNGEGPEYGYNCNGDCIVDLDCNGDCGGSAYSCTIFGIEVCVEGNTGIASTCEDPCGVGFGTGYFDQCGVCDDNPDNDCQLDCDGNWGGTAVVDTCGICNGDGLADGACDCGGNVEDCAGVCGGSSVVDECGECGGDTSCQTLGDLNGDGTFNVVDIVLLVNAVMDWTYNPLGDMNEDGVNNVVDVVLLVNLVLYGPTDEGCDVELWGECYNIQNTTSLNLSQNGLTGEIPPQIGNLINLTYLNLYANQLTGEIPPEIGNLINLTHLDLQMNQLSGQIPYEIGNLINLNILHLNDNNLSGQIPENICDLALDWSGIWNHYYQIPFFDIDDNNLCPPYPDCLYEEVEQQNTSNCP